MAIYVCANLLSAADGSHRNCSHEVASTCGRCGLVAYCSKDCQVKHWNVHKVDCNDPVTKSTWTPRWDQENRKPAFIDSGARWVPFGAEELRYLWGNTPAFDILKLEQNEGKLYNGDLAILFAASGDMRNVLKTITSLPSDYSGQITMMLNDRDIFTVARNIFTILLLGNAEPGDSLQAVIDTIVHLWYSRCLTDEHCTILQSLRPIISDVCGKITQKDPKTLQSKRIALQRAYMTIILLPSQWIQLLNILDATHDPVKATESYRDVSLGRPDHLDRSLFNIRQNLHQRKSITRFRGSGLLLPFGTVFDGFSKPNPTMYDAQGLWLQKDAADPRHGWRTQEIRDHHNTHDKLPGLKNDIYGHLNSLFRHTLYQLHRKMTNTTIGFKTTSMLAQDLSTTFDDIKFDRVDVSNIADAGYLGINKTLKTMQPLLQPANKHSTLITLFMNAIGQMENLPGRELKLMQQCLPLVVPFCAPSGPKSNSNATYIRTAFAKEIFYPTDTMFDEYMKQLDFKTAASDAKLTMKKRNTIIAAWPYRFGKRLGEPGAQEAFDALLADSVTGVEHYVEWQL